MTNSSTKQILINLIRQFCQRAMSRSTGLGSSIPYDGAGRNCTMSPSARIRFSLVPPDSYSVLAVSSRPLDSRSTT